MFCAVYVPWIGEDLGNFLLKNEKNLVVIRGNSDDEIDKR